MAVASSPSLSPPKPRSVLLTASCAFAIPTSERKRRHSHAALESILGGNRGRSPWGNCSSHINLIERFSAAAQRSRGYRPLKQDHTPLSKWS